MGEGAAEVLVSGGEGEVVACFTRAAYLRLPGGLLALTAPGTLVGPLHVVLDVAPDALVAGTPATVTGECLVIGPSTVTLAGVRRWVGPMPRPVELLRAVDLLTLITEAFSARSALARPPFDRTVDGWRQAVADGDLATAARILGGVGPGLTPSGDDVLAGVLLIARLLWGAAAESYLLSCARLASTGELSHAYLRWAGRGQSLEPVHRLLVAACDRDEDEALKAVAAVGRVGASSGCDLCLGLRTALNLLPPRRAEASSTELQRVWHPDSATDVGCPS